MAIELYKQPSESRLYHFNFSNLLAAGETIASVTSVTQIKYNRISGSQNLTIGTPTNSTSAVQVRLSGGTNGEKYKVTALITTSSSNILEMEGILYIKDF